MTILFIATYLIAALGHLTQIANLKGDKWEWLENIVVSIFWPVHLLFFWAICLLFWAVTKYQDYKNKTNTL